MSARSTRIGSQATVLVRMRGSTTVQESAARATRKPCCTRTRSSAHEASHSRPTGTPTSRSRFITRFVCASSASRTLAASDRKETSRSFCSFFYVKKSLCSPNEESRGGLNRCSDEPDGPVVHLVSGLCYTIRVRTRCCRLLVPGEEDPGGLMKIFVWGA